MSAPERHQTSPGRQDAGLWATLAKTHAAGTILPAHGVLPAGAGGAVRIVCAPGRGARSDRVAADPAAGARALQRRVRPPHAAAGGVPAAAYAAAHALPAHPPADACQRRAAGRARAVAAGPPVAALAARTRGRGRDV